MSTLKNTPIDKIGERIRSYRKSKNYKLIELSNLIGISHSSLSSIENNKSRPSAETISNFCLHTDINLEWLLTGKGETTVSKTYCPNYENTKNFPEILYELGEWILDETSKNPKKDIWFEIQLLESFPGFKKWRDFQDRKRDRAANE